MSSKTTPSPIEVQQALKSVGNAMRLARKRRLLRQEDLSARLDITRQTYAKLEAGNGSTGLGVLLEVLWHFGLLDQLLESLKPENDAMGLSLEQRLLPKLVRRNEGLLDDDF